MTLDRTVHAKTADGTEVARYDRAGKWYAESPDGKRRSISLSQAVDLALTPGTTGIDRRRYGGLRFWAELNKRKK